jgi:site-specific recombinase XerD
MTEVASTEIVEVSGQELLPPALLGTATPEIKKRVESFYFSVAEIFERWVTRRTSLHTQRAYREDIMAFVKFAGIAWPRESRKMLMMSIKDVQAFRDELLANDLAPKTINRRISSLSSFYKYLAGAAAELRLPITVPNPAHAQFIARESSDPRDETKAMSETRVRQLMGLPAGESIIDYRDRAILKFYLYSGARISTGCRLKVSDFHQDGDEATIKLNEKGGKRRAIGIHYAAAQAISEYIEKAGLKSGPLFRPKRHSKLEELADRHMSTLTMYRVVLSYLERLPGAMHEVQLPDGTTREECIYTPHSIRASTATILLAAGVDIRKVQELLGHRHVTTTQIYDKRRRTTKESASHDMPV